MAKPAIIQSNNPPPKCDIFCRVVDNFGDIGVCWRLARQLAHSHGWHVRLWVDDWAVAGKIIQALNPVMPSGGQIVEQITLQLWPSEQQAFSAEDIPHIVIEAFACELPLVYQKAMQHNAPIWINLEYLSAEAWVAQYHALPSIHPQLGLRKYFFFPGFDAGTGGLLREDGLQQARLALLNSSAAQAAFWQSLGLAPHNSLRVSLFCYPTAPVISLLQALSSSPQNVQLLVPLGVATEDIKAYFAVDSLQVGDTLSQQQLSVHIIPFLSQAQYDQLLWLCDINFVRGEDSWVRALWAARPFIWLPYVQTENTHLDKLQAFLDVYAEHQPSLQQAHFAWSGAGFSAALWDSLYQQLPELQQHAQAQTANFAKMADLATKLVIFCKNYS
jgi:uncharacterized repeat protein (TIGR03837 family)